MFKKSLTEFVEFQLKHANVREHHYFYIFYLSKILFNF